MSNLKDEVDAREQCGGGGVADEEPQGVSLCLNSQPEKQDQETRRKWAVRANDKDKESRPKASSNVGNMEPSAIPLRSHSYTVNKIRMYYKGNKTASGKL